MARTAENGQRWTQRRPSWYRNKIRGRIERAHKSNDYEADMEKQQRYVGLGEVVTYCAKRRCKINGQGPG